MASELTQWRERDIECMGKTETDPDLLVWLVRLEGVWAASLSLTGVVRDEQKAEAEKRGQAGEGEVKHWN